MIDVIIGRIVAWGTHRGVAGEGGVVAGGVSLPSLVPPGQVGQLSQENGRLETVEPAVGADLFVKVLPRAAVLPEAAKPFGHRIVLSNHQPGIAPGTQILGGEEGERPHPAELTGPPPGPIDLSAGPNRLSPVLDDWQIVPSGNGQNVLHGCHLAEDMDHNDRTSPRSDSGADGSRRDVEGGGVDVYKDRSTARIMDGSCGGKEGKRSRNDLIPGPEVERLEREEQRVSSAGAGNPVPGSRKAGDLNLELRHLRAHDEPLPFDNCHHGGEHVVLDRAVLRHKIQQGYVHSQSGNWKAPARRPDGGRARARCVMEPSAARELSRVSGVGQSGGEPTHFPDKWPHTRRTKLDPR